MAADGELCAVLDEVFGEGGEDAAERFGRAAAFLKRVRASEQLGGALHSALGDALLRGERSAAVHALAARGALLYAEPEAVSVLRAHFGRSARGRLAQAETAALLPVLRAMESLPEAVAARWRATAERVFAEEYAMGAAAGLFDALLDAREQPGAAEAHADDMAAALARAASPRLLEDVAHVHVRALKRRLLHAGVSGATVAGHLLAAADALRRIDPSGLLADRALEASAARMHQPEACAAILEAAAAEKHVPQPEGLPPGWQPDPPGAAPAVRMAAKAGRASLLAAAAADALARYREHVLAPGLLAALAAESPAARRAALTALYAQAEGLRARMPPATWSAAAAMLSDAERAAHTSSGHVLLAAAHVYWPWAPAAEDAGAEDAVRALAPGLGRLIDRWRAGHTLRGLRVRPEHSLAVVRVDYAAGGSAAHCARLDDARVLLHVSSAPRGRLPLAALLAEFPAAAVHAAVDAWARRGVLVVDRAAGLVALAERLPAGAPCDAAFCGAIDCDGAPGAPSASPDAIVLAWPYVQAMLTNLGAQKAERIQAMLGVFAPDYAGHQTELQALLDAKVRQGALLRSAAGAYSLAPPQ